MDLNHYWTNVATLACSETMLPYGQVCFHMLQTMRPDLASRVTNTAADPYYVTETDSPTMLRFVEWVSKNW
jgi:hypothetical protein